MTSYKYPTPSKPFQEGLTEYDDYDPNDVPADQRPDVLPGRNKKRYKNLKSDMIITL